MDSLSMNNSLSAHAKKENLGTESAVVRDMKKLFKSVELSSLGKRTELEIDRLNPKEEKGVPNVKEVFAGSAKTTGFLNSTIGSLLGISSTDSPPSDLLKNKDYLNGLNAELAKHSNKVKIEEKKASYVYMTLGKYYEKMESSFVLNELPNGDYQVRYCLGKNDAYGLESFAGPLRNTGIMNSRFIENMFGFNPTPNLLDAEKHADFTLKKLDQLFNTKVADITERVDVEVPFDFDFSTLFQESYLDSTVGLEQAKFSSKLTAQFSHNWTLVISVAPMLAGQVYNSSLAKLGNLMLVVVPRLRISKKAAWYLTQSPDLNHIKLSTMYLWALNWSKETVSSKKKKNIRLLSSLSNNFNFSKLKEEVLGVKPLESRVCPDTKLFIDFEGNFRYAPSTSSIDESTIQAYENEYDNFVRECAKLQEPVDLTNPNATTSQANSPALANLYSIVDRIRGFSSCPLISNWDMNICASIHHNEPTKLSTINIQGSIKPSMVALNEVLNDTLGNGMQQILGGLEKNYESVLFNSQSYIRENQIKRDLAAIYAYLVQCNKVKDIDAYLARATQDIHQKVIDDTYFEFDIYHKVNPRYGKFISSDCTKIGASRETDPDRQKALLNELNDETPYIKGKVDHSPAELALLQNYNRFIALYHVWSEIFIISQSDELNRWELARYDEEKKKDPNIPEFYIEDSRYFLNINSPGTTVKNLASIIQHYIVGRAFSMICRDLLVIMDSQKNPVFTHNSAYPKPVVNGEPLLPGFDRICNAVMPFLSTFGYVLTKVKTIGNQAALEQGKFVRTGNELQTIPGGDQQFTYHNHQAKGLDVLRNEPRIAILDIAPGGGKCLIGSSLVATDKGLLTLEELWEKSGEWIDNNFRELNVGVKTLEGVKQTDKIYRSKGLTTKVTMADGQTLQGLPEHRMSTLTDKGLEFVSLKDLKVGDYLPRASTKLFNEEFLALDSYPLSLDLARVLGFCLAKNQDWSNPQFVETCQNVFGAEKDQEQVNKQLAEWQIQDYLKVIRQASHACQLAFMEEVIANSNGRINVEKKEAQILKSILDNLGIHAYILNKTEVVIDPKFIESTTELTEVPGLEQASQLISLMLDVGVDLDPSLADVKVLTANTVRLILSQEVSGYQLEQLEVLGKIQLFNELVEFITVVSEYSWSKVVKKKEKGEELVYDLSVPGPHHYAVNGFYGHNTLCVLADCLMLMGQGKVKRPLFIAPQNLIANWVIDLNNVATRDKYNCVILTAKTASKWGEDKLKDMIISSPPNTIFFTDMHFIGMPSRKIVLQMMNIEQMVYGNLEWLKQFNFDYLAIDEVHYLKNAKGQRGGSTRSKLFAELTLNPNIKYIRLATGTIINNEIDDIIGQARLFDPSIFKTRKNFMKLYGDTDGGVEIWSPDAANRVRYRLSKYCAVIRAKRKDWAYALPIPVEQHPNKWFVDMDPDFEKVYEHILLKTIEEIKGDPDLLAKLKESGENLDDDEADLFDDDEAEVANSEDEEDTLSGKLRLYLDRIETFIGAPEADKLNGWDGLNFGSLMTPKMPKLIELLDEHFAEDKTGKVIVFVRHIPVVDGILNRLPPHYRKMAVGYHGTIKTNLNDFMFDNNIRIIVGVENSMNTGKNLQIASRIIRMELCWTPGDIDQAISRIFRPDHFGKFNRSVINSDWIVCNGTIEVPKLGRLISKMLEKAKFDEYGNGNYDTLKQLPKLPLNLKKFLNPDMSIRYKEDIEQYTEEYYKLSQIQTNEFVEERSKYYDSNGNKTKPSCIAAKVASELPGSKQITFMPIVSDQNYVMDPDDDGLVPFKQWLCDNKQYADNLALLSNQDILAYSEFGYGIVYGASSRTGGVPNKVTIITSYGTKQKVPADALFIATKTKADPTIEKAKKFYGVNHATTRKIKYKGSDPRKSAGLLYRENGEYKNYFPDSQTGVVKIKPTVQPSQAPTNQGALLPTDQSNSPQVKVQVQSPVVKPKNEEKADQVQTPTFVPPESGTGVDNKLYASALLIDDNLFLAFTAKDPDAADLSQFNFKRVPAFIGIQLRSPQELNKVLDFVKSSGFKVVDSANKFERLNDRLANKAKVLDGKLYVEKEAEDIKFLVLNHKAPNNQGSIKLNYLVENRRIYIVFNELTHMDAAKALRGKVIPHVAGKFRRHDAMFMRGFKDKTRALTVLDKINRVIKIVNYGSITEEIQQLGKMGSL